MSAHHIPLTCDGRRALFPAAATLFREVDGHVVAHFGDTVYHVSQTYDQIAATLSAPTVQDLCGTLISASNEAISSLQFALDHRRMPARDVTTMLAGAVRVLTEAVQATEGR